MKPRVLVVDDDEQNRALLSEKLLLDGYDVEKATNGLEALAKVSSFLPDLVLLDVMMPVMDGYEALRRLKSDEATRYIPVIILTGRTEIDDKVHGLEAGAEDYINKPYSLTEVSARVKSLLSMRALQTRLRETEKMAALGEMVDGIAHEVRNPLTAIGGMARRLFEGETSPQHKLYAQNIIRSVERLERMLLRIDEYKSILTTTLSRGNLNDVIEAAVKDIREFIEGREREVTIRTNLMQRPPAINMDYGNLKIAIFNILQNSVEAIEKNGEISIESFPAMDQAIVVKIVDNGCGIGNEDIRKIFNPFQTSKIEGAGLGLTICYRIIQDHGGEIEVESEKGKGTTVTLRFHPAR